MDNETDGKQFIPVKGFKIRIDEKNPVHTRFTIFAGDCLLERMATEDDVNIFGQITQASTFANCGQLAMRNDEYKVFRRVLISARPPCLVEEWYHLD